VGNEKGEGGREGRRRRKGKEKGQFNETMGRITLVFLFGHISFFWEGRGAIVWFSLFFWAFLLKKKSYFMCIEH